ncbi:hypothetical protein M422DRAFT_163118 [Sphaerobolus stellatus SS14]|uniref:DNA helicase n=1 Tax=Sphaerobolus stellatus (strain SS14) TaxID=990650 RepID=A0A0C9VWB6_SPHS4|nr:hypothetical protein M422DRAFT_163118 [Sphaerobolus stellatus SS14]
MELPHPNFQPENIQEREIEAIVGHTRDPGRRQDPEDIWHENIRFHTKWKGNSHLHNTNHTYDFLKRYKGLNRVNNYIRQRKAYESTLKMEGLSAQDSQTLQLANEREKELIATYKMVERIANKKEVDQDVQYFVKWQNLNYDQATWERQDDIIQIAHEQIDAYQRLERHGQFPYRSQIYDVNQRPQFVTIERDPDYITTQGILEDYQLAGLNWLAERWCLGENNILADESGLGKMVQTVTFLSYLFHTHNHYGPFLVIVPLSTIPTWEKHFKTWAPDLDTISYIGNNLSRENIRKYVFGSSLEQMKPNVLLTTYEWALRDATELGVIGWQMLAVDEAHRLNSDSQMYEALKSFNASAKLLITDTPLQDHPKEFLSLVHFLTYDKFDLDKQPGMDVANLRPHLRKFMLRRLKQDVIKSVDPANVHILRVNMSGLQKYAYKSVLTKNYQGLMQSSQGDTHISLLNIASMLKGAANHPYLSVSQGLNSKEWTSEETLQELVTNSGKMALLDELLTKFKAEGHRVLILSHMFVMLDIISNYMSLRNYQFQRVDGTMASGTRKRSMEHFNQAGSPDFAFLLVTRATELAINLEKCDIVIIFDSDWNHQNDLNAISQIHGADPQRVDIYRLITRDTVEEAILTRQYSTGILGDACT